MPPNKDGAAVVVAVPKLDPNRLGAVVCVPNKLGAAVVVAATPPNKLGVCVVTVPPNKFVVPDAGVEKAPVVVPAWVPKKLGFVVVAPNKLDEAEAGAPKVLPNAGAVDVAV